MICLDPQSQEYVQINFRALTDALLPTETQTGYGFVSSVSDMGVHEYIIYTLDHYISIQLQMHHAVVPLSYPTAMMLDIAAIRLANMRQAQTIVQGLIPGGRMFSNLSRQDRVRTLSILENLDIDLHLLPPPYQNNAGLVKHVTDAITRFSMFGYYSEWPAYGSTRLYPPNDRRLEFFPLTWQRIGYPGVSLGYRDFRGFLLKMGRDEEKNEKGT